jgi:Peptidase family M20/M25/M40
MIPRCTALAAFAVFTSCVLAQSEPLSPQAARKLAQGSFREYLELLSLPNDSINASDIQRNTDFLERAFQKRGFTVKQLANQGKPMLYAEWPKKIPGAKTVLYYMHLDGQPVVEREWAQASPWKPVVKKRGADGKWEIVDTDFLFQEKLDLDLRVFARASSDDKGPIMMFLAAFDGLREAGLDPVINVKVLLDSEEEKGSPSIPAVVTANKELLKCDALVVHGPKQPLHSGHFGNYVPNPENGDRPRTDPIFLIRSLVPALSGRRSLRAVNRSSAMVLDGRIAAFRWSYDSFAIAASAHNECGPLHGLRLGGHLQEQ